MILRGCGTALVTPFRSDGRLDEETLTKLVEWQFESGVHFLVACGTTAETPTLTHEEWLRVIGIVSQTAAGRVPVIRYPSTRPVMQGVRPYATCPHPS